MYHIDLWVLKNLCKPWINPTWLWFMIFFMFCWIWFDNILLRIFASMFISDQFSSVAQSCPTLCELMNCSTPGLSVYHQLPEFTQTHVHRLGDAIHPSHPLPSPSALNFCLHRGLFKWVRSSHEGQKYWSFSFNISPSNECPGLISFSMDWLDLMQSKGL